MLAVLLALYGLHPISATGQASKFLPHDEASQQPDFFSFRARLLVSLAGRDTTGLLNVVAPQSAIPSVMTTAWRPFVGYGAWKHRTARSGQN